MVGFHGFLVGETPHISVRSTSCLFLSQSLYIHTPTIITHIYSSYIESGLPSSEGGGTVTQQYVLVLRVLLCLPVYPFRDRYILLIMSVTHIMYPLLHNAVSHRLSSHDIHHSFHSPHIPLTIHPHSHVPIQCSHPLILYKLITLTTNISPS